MVNLEDRMCSLSKAKMVKLAFQIRSILATIRKDPVTPMSRFQKMVKYIRYGAQQVLVTMKYFWRPAQPIPQHWESYQFLATIQILCHLIPNWHYLKAAK